MVSQIELLDGFSDDPRDFVGTNTLDKSVEFQRLFYSEDWEYRIKLRAVSNQITSLRELRLHIETLNGDLTSCGRDFSRQALESCRLAGSINSQKTEALTIVKTKRCLPHSHNWQRGKRLILL